MYNAIARALLIFGNDDIPVKPAMGIHMISPYMIFLRKVTEPARAICQFEDFAHVSTTCHLDTVHRVLLHVEMRTTMPLD